MYGDVMYLKMKLILVFLLLKICFNNSSQAHEHYRHKRFKDETTTAEPNKNLPNNSSFYTNTNNVPNSSTIVMSNLLTNSHTPTPMYPKNTSITTDINLQYTRLLTTNSHHTNSMTTAIPKIVVESNFIAQERHFDVLSFLGGCLFTFFLTGIGYFGWKIYALHLERNYRTI